jgi:hypothetical protein
MWLGSGNVRCAGPTSLSPTARGSPLVRSSRSASRSPPAMSPRGSTSMSISIPNRVAWARRRRVLLFCLTTQLPVGLTATGVVVGDRRMPSLQQAVTSCTWQIDVRNVAESHHDSSSRSIDCLRRDEVMVTRERKGKEITDDHPARRARLGCGSADRKWCAVDRRTRDPAARGSSHRSAVSPRPAAR